MSKPNMPAGGPGPRKIDFRQLGRVIKLLYVSYPRLLPLAMFCMVFSAVVSACPAIFTQKIINTVDVAIKGRLAWSEVAGDIVPLVITLAALYLTSLALVALQAQMMAYITQGFLSKMRCRMFDGMQNLPIKYFDTHKHGDIMSHYTNDIDTLRQLVSQSLPSLLQSCVIVLTVLFIMLWSSIWMTLVVLIGVVVMIVVSGKIGGGSAHNFIKL